MKPITFSCEKTLDLSPEDISRQILDVTKWLDFKGFGPLPGIKVAEFEVRTPDIVGSRIRVTNTDGSKHVEEIVEWKPDSLLQLHMKDFSAPLSRLATRIEETWEFERVGNETKVTRCFQMHAKSALSWPLLWMISFILKRAIARHLQQMRSLP
ncbi:MAG: SRPBCC family protein [Planctomycetota bacterium]